MTKKEMKAEAMGLLQKGNFAVALAVVENREGVQKLFSLMERMQTEVLADLIQRVTEMEAVFERFRDRMDSALNRAGNSRQDLESQISRVRDDLYRAEGSIKDLEGQVSRLDRGW